MSPTVLSAETIRQALLRLGVGWKRAKRWLTSPDPAYAQKNAAATLPTVYLIGDSTVNNHALNVASLGRINQRGDDVGLRRGVQHDGAVGGAAHPAVADTHHVAHALREQFRRQWHVRDFRHPGVALGPAAAQHDALRVRDAPARARLRSRTILRRPCGSSENAWSVPFIARFSVKCFSTIRAPSM